MPKYVLTVLDPVGVSHPADNGLTPRLPTLANRTVGLIINGKPNSEQLLNGVQSRLEQQYPGIRFRRWRKQSSSLPIAPADLEAAVGECEAVLVGVGD